MHIQLEIWGNYMYPFVYYMEWLGRVMTSIKEQILIRSAVLTFALRFKKSMKKCLAFKAFPKPHMLIDCAEFYFHNKVPKGLLILVTIGPVRVPTFPPTGGFPPLKGPI